LEQEFRLMRHKLYAALAFARANRLDRVVMDSPKPRFGIVTTGKSYLDVRQALEDLGIDDAHAAELGIRVYKVGMSWPLEREGIRHFAEGLEEILVVEEKRAVIENQLKEQLYNWRADVRPRVVGKFDENREWILPSVAELSPAMIARVIARRIAYFATSKRIEERLKFLSAKEEQLARLTPAVSRIPWFCSGCPHNTSTKVPEGSRAVAGIGCHYMASWMPGRDTATFTQMGGEGVPWIGQAPFTETKHIFANLGDGTYNHSGILAIRAAVDARVNITYKILFNDAVAMTGGQHHDGGLLTPMMIARQVVAEGVAKLVVVTDEPDKYPIDAGFPPHTPIFPREELDAVQCTLRETPGVTVIIYDQTCAAEKRRRRKRKLLPDPPKRAFINQRVCEGCGDCSKVSNCLSVVPVETEYGRKREIDQSSCNKDFSCLNGFCPSFVTVHGGRLKKPAAVSESPSPPQPNSPSPPFRGEREGPAQREGEVGRADAPGFPHLTPPLSAPEGGEGASARADIFTALPDPVLPALDQPYGILVTGVGGTGVVTIGALLGMAAHLEGKGVSVLDMTGLAQKGGAVFSHIRIARTPAEIAAVRIAAGGARLLLGCDMLVAASSDGLSKIQKGTTRAVVNAHETITGGFTTDPDLQFPTEATRSALVEAAGSDGVDFVEASRLAVSLLGDSIAANLFMLGFAWQKGLVPVSFAALDRAIELNGVSVEFNRRAFLWGRRAAVDLPAVEALSRPRGEPVPPPQTLDALIERRAADLVAYQNAAYAERYRILVARVREAEAKAMPGRTDLTDAVARNLYKLLAYKDEYEVARLYTDGSFERRLRETFEGDFRLEFHLAPPATAPRDPVTGHLRKQSFGPWMMTVFRLLAPFKFLRSTAWDPFGRSEERQTERRLIGEYEAAIDEALSRLSPATHATAVALAQLPEHIRGYGHIKDKNLADAKHAEARLLAELRGGGVGQEAAE
ncbi:MAG TPA: indolepyruvate ferredoxin oxidoreductase family protein, partial [Stellaceae bacterium]|nr:indolepyruvate ferredoxin oxidoreductase family protein [Stellaceae bacterium]